MGKKDKKNTKRTAAAAEKPKEKPTSTEIDDIFNKKKLNDTSEIDDIFNKKSAKPVKTDKKKSSDKEASKKEDASDNSDSEEDNHDEEELDEEDAKKVEEVVFAELAAVKSKNAKKRSAPAPSADDDFSDSRGIKKTKRTTEDGYPLYDVKDLNIGLGGDTPECPFDCQCCF
ncbi:hypothetical protein BDF20DRAFT_890739 [Mycotypha africana]|uniref:uncharacterized protein n=1 Tax=Mycotypha africana TaxID=64632 RepID=UPI0023017D37|nr:uncharacterized protein BDF20DRAFT_890739 [Mycotypha africana]KAI8970348.1 hypothetical protein BDF20DRAFT_890739 [Mycotypha africana]